MDEDRSKSNKRNGCIGCFSMFVYGVLLFIAALTQIEIILLVVQGIGLLYLLCLILYFIWNEEMRKKYSKTSRILVTIVVVLIILKFNFGILEYLGESRKSMSGK